MNMKVFGITIKTKGEKKKRQSSSDDVKRKKNETSYEKKMTVSKSLLAKREESLIRSVDDVPDNSGLVIFDDFSPLRKGGSDECILLSVSREQKHAIALVSRRRINMPLDGLVEKAKASCRRNGWRLLKTYYIEPSLIADFISDERKKQDKNSVNSDMALKFDEILQFACDNNVSDIHFEVTEEKALVRVRRNSLLENYTQMGVDYAFDLCTVIYQVLSESDSTDISFLPRKQQSSMIVREIPGHGIVRVRLNTIPTAPSGFDMVMRVLKTDKGNSLTLKQLGYNSKLIKSLEIASAKPVGALIIAGTTGSGKSTTLKTLLENKVNQFTTPSGITIKIITVEDPPEYNIQGVSQCNVSTSKSSQDADESKNPFGDSIKAAMRCDPDILMAGEVRDKDSAELLMHITLSGHQVMTTIHASSAISIIARLRNNGIPNDALGNSDFLSALVYQKLVPKVCHNCGFSIDEFMKKDISIADQEVLSRVDQVIPDNKKEGIFFRNKNGCSECTSGVTGQTVVAEIILPDHEMLGHFISGEDHKAWHHHKAMGGDTIIDHAIEKIINGVCDPRDIEVKIGLITMDMVMEDSKFDHSEFETHGIKLGENSFELVEISKLDKISLAKVLRAEKLISAKKERGEIGLISSNTRLVLANMLHNKLFNSREVAEEMLKVSCEVNAMELDKAMEELVQILK